MAQPTQQQLSDMSTLAGGGAQQSDGAFLNGINPYYDDQFYKAIDASRQEWQISPGNAIDLYNGFLIKKYLMESAGKSLVPDSSSADVMLAFVGRTIEIYQEQNP